MGVMHFHHIFSYIKTLDWSRVTAVGGWVGILEDKNFLDGKELTMATKPQHFPRHFSRQH